jgi:LysR family transcriptional activator of nhaA
MNRLHYHHLQYFWLVAKERNLSKASVRLRLAPSTLSGQIHSFERVLGQPLFARVGRRLELTDAGRLVYRSLIRNCFSGGTGTRPLGPV